MLFVWVALYGLAHVVGDLMTASGQGQPWLRGILLAAYVLLFLFWILRTGRGKLVHLNRMKVRNRRELLELLPLAVFPVYNLVTGHTVPGGAFLMEMLCICLTEELFFRGFLLSYLRRRGNLPGILLTSMLFSGLHFTNVFSGGALDYVWLQVVSSFFVSICYCGVTIRYGSLLPCVAAHFLTNITGTGIVSGSHAAWGLWGCIAIYALWAWKLCLDFRKKTERIL